MSSSRNADGRPSSFLGRTAWARSLETPLREFLRTETGGAAFLLAATVAALVWVNVDESSYDRLWGTTLSIDLGGAGVALDLRHWVNSGLMTFFFFVVGLEARREIDLGELRERRRFALPLLRFVTPINDDLTPGPAVGLPLLIRDGQNLAQLPLQALLAFLSLANR